MSDAVVNTFAFEGNICMDVRGIASTGIKCSNLCTAFCDVVLTFFGNALFPAHDSVAPVCYC